MSHHDHTLPGLRIGRASEIMPGTIVTRSSAESLPPYADRQRISEAMARVLDERLKHFDYGHTFEKDLIQDERFLLQRGKSYATAATEDIQFRKGAWRETAIRNAARAAALLLAFIEVQLERLAQEQAGNGDAE